MATTPKTTTAKRGPGRPRKVPLTEPAPVEVKFDQPAPEKVARAKPTAKAKTAAKPKPPAKAKVSTKPKARGTPRPAPATQRARAAVRDVAGRATEAVKAIPLPDVTPRQAAGVAAGAGGFLAAIGAALFLWRATKTDQPEYRVVEADGDFEIREYPALVTAATEARGPRHAALDRGFGTLADYIFAKSRTGRKLAMTAPVLSDRGEGDAWRTRFIMPIGTARADLPTAPAGVALANEPPRRIGAVRFGGRVDDALLEEKEGALRSWLQLKHLPSEAKAEHAFYNSPMMPGPFRRNEVLVQLSSG